MSFMIKILANFVRISIQQKNIYLGLKPILDRQVC